MVCFCALACVSCGPHMNKQPSIHAFEKQLPRDPRGIVPTRGTYRTLTIQQSRLTTNPLPRNKTNLYNGKVFYDYYCLMCHGAQGDGNGGAGQGYYPKPTDLASPKVTGMNDGQLYYGMLVGTGHDPVMIETVHPAQRWPLVMYVRTFAAKPHPKLKPVPPVPAKGFSIPSTMP